MSARPPFQVAKARRSSNGATMPRPRSTRTTSALTSPAIAMCAWATSHVGELHALRETGEKGDEAAPEHQRRPAQKRSEPPAITGDPAKRPQMPGQQRRPDGE